MFHSWQIHAAKKDGGVSRNLPQRDHLAIPEVAVHRRLLAGLELVDDTFEDAVVALDAFGERVHLFDEG